MQLRYVMSAFERGLPLATANGRTRDQLILIEHMMRDAARGQRAVSRGLQAIAVTLHQLRPNAFDVSGFKHLSAAKCVRKAVDEYAYPTPAERDRVRVVVNHDFVFNGQETLLVMVILNLMKNAMYYFPMYPYSSVTITIDNKAGGSIVVRDTGPGIPANTMRNLFKDFSTAGKAGGTGLGLAFCKRATRALGGDISCKSEMGEYTEFSMKLPVVLPRDIQAAQAQVMARAGEFLAGRKVLVVDDDQLMRRTTGPKLAAMGCTFDEAIDGADALEKLAHTHYDLLVMDIHMPVFDGYETTRRIRAGAVPGRARLAARLCPATVAIHDDGDVLR